MADVRPVAVVTESIACIPEEKAASLDITVIPVPFEYSGKEYLDGVDITPDEFFGLLRPNLPPAVTSAPAPGAYLEAFRKLSLRGYDVLHISPTPTVTRMHDTALLGRRLALEDGVRERIEVFDSGTATMSQVFLALEAARLARAGAGIEEVLDRIRNLLEYVSLLVTLDTLEYLATASRIPRIGALFGKALRIKPIIFFGHGTVKPLENPRTRRRSVNRLPEMMAERLRGNLPLHVAVQHAGAPKEAQALCENIGTRFQPAEIFINQFSPVMGSYTGPGLLGLAFYEDPGTHRPRRGRG